MFQRSLDWIDCNVSPTAVLDFWFGPSDAASHGKSRPEWFRKDDAFDAALRERFSMLHADVAAGRMPDWERSVEGVLAQIIVLDQFSRNMFRNTPAAFASDAKALRLARALVGRAADLPLLPVMRWFVYLPFEHSENLADQDEAVRLFRTLPPGPDADGVIEYAEKHRDVIRRFGRFPHRNAILGRTSTAEETAFLQTPGSSF